MLFPESHGYLQPLQLHKWCSTTQRKMRDLLTSQDWKFLHHYDICLKTDHCAAQPKSSMKYIPLHCMALIEHSTWNGCAITKVFDHYKGVCDGLKTNVMARPLHFCNGRDKKTHTRIDFLTFSTVTCNGPRVMDAFFSYKKRPNVQRLFSQLFGLCCRCCLCVGCVFLERLIF